MGRYDHSRKVEEGHILRIAHFVCSLSPENILLIGGGNVLTETAGYRRMRDVSDDVDFIANKEGMNAARTVFDLKNKYRNGAPSDGDVTYVNDIVVMFFHNTLKGWLIPESVFRNYRIHATSVGLLYSIPPELNIALKIRRGSSLQREPHIYGKDALDFATIHAGMSLGNSTFDTEQFAKNMSCGVCQSCRLSSKLACLKQIGKSHNQLPELLQSAYISTIRQCHSELERHCKY